MTLRYAALTVVVALCAAASGMADDVAVEMTVEGAIQRAEFAWTEAEPSWQSLIEYRDLAIMDFRVEGEVSLQNDDDAGFCVRGAAARGRINSGDSWDTDIVGGQLDNESVSEASGEMWDLSVDLGRRISLGRLIGPDPTHLVLRVGFARTEHDFEEEDLHNTFPDDYYVGGDVATYDAVWKGPYGSLGLSAGLTEGFRVSTELNIQYAYYEGLADWILRDDFAHPSFEHTGTGMGIEWRIAARYTVTPWMAVGANAGVVRKWIIWEGESETWFSDGSAVDIDLEKSELRSSRAAIAVTITL